MTHLTSAQAAQQNNRDPKGRYQEHRAGEAPASALSSTDPVGFVCSECGGECVDESGTLLHLNADGTVDYRADHEPVNEPSGRTVEVDDFVITPTDAFKMNRRQAMTDIGRYDGNPANPQLRHNLGMSAIAVLSCLPQDLDEHDSKVVDRLDKAITRQAEAGVGDSEDAGPAVAELRVALGEAIKVGDNHVRTLEG